MKTRLAAVALAAVLGALAGTSGCVENRASLQTQMVCVPTQDCTFSSTCDKQFIGFPSLDKTTSTNDTLWLMLQVANQLPNNADDKLGRANTNDAHIDEIYVEYEGAMGGDTAVGANYIVPAGGTAVVSAKFPLTGATNGEVLAHLRFRGYYDDQTRFETGDFPITIVVCGVGGAGTCAPVPAACVGIPTCPPSGAGQLPLNCSAG